MTEDKTKIRGEITNYFQKLFLSQTRSFNSKDDFVTSMEGRAVFEDGMTKIVSEVEVKKVLDSKQKNKAPGIDGIPYEFYLTFWRLIKSEMTQMTNHVLNNGMITESQGTALIRLIPKHRKPKKITDYSPVSLLCTDYKIVAGVIAARLQITLQNSIGHEQVGGVPGRNIVSNLTTIRDTIQLVSERGTHGGLISVDLSKAFDRVNRNLVWMIMKKMGYPTEFVKWCQTLYSRSEVKVINGKQVIDGFKSGSSICQGCPLSMHLF